MYRCIRRRHQMSEEWSTNAITVERYYLQANLHDTGLFMYMFTYFHSLTRCVWMCCAANTVLLVYVVTTDECVLRSSNRRHNRYGIYWLDFTRKNIYSAQDNSTMPLHMRRLNVGRKPFRARWVICEFKVQHMFILQGYVPNISVIQNLYK